MLAKLRILEARRADDRERLREVDKLKEESEEWIKVKEKSKGLFLSSSLTPFLSFALTICVSCFLAKLIELTSELKELKSQSKELTSERDVFELKFADLTDQVEISLLDKEMAEEKYEASEHALELAKEKVAELEVEVAVLREENCKFDCLASTKGKH